MFVNFLTIEWWITVVTIPVDHYIYNVQVLSIEAFPLYSNST